MIHRLIVFRCLLGCLGILTSEATSFAQFPGGNPLPGTIPKSSLRLVLEDVIRIPPNDGEAARLELLYHAADGSGRLYIADQHGRLYSFFPGDDQPTLFLDVEEHVPDFVDGDQRGLRSFAFHPDHASSGASGSGKFYTAHSVKHQGPGSGDHDSVVAEWTCLPDGRVDTSIAPREVLRVVQPAGDHNIGRIGFRPNLDTSNSDYGNLYIALADGANHRPPGDQGLNPNAQDRSNLLGSILRIDPLADANNNTPLRVPDDNPFVGEVDVRPEIWAYGLRNPHQFSWDVGGSGAMFIAEIGQSNIEELNLGIVGANYGWSLREGTFDVAGKAPLIPMQVDSLPSDHASDSYTYPVAQYDHVMGNERFRNGSSAIAGGFVYRGSRIPALDDVYFFGDFAFSDGPIFALSVEGLVAQDDFSNLANAHDGRLAAFSQVGLIYQGQEMSFLEIIQQSTGDSRLRRTDLRFGQGEDGEIYILNKHDGWVRRIAAVPEPSSGQALLLLVGVLAYLRRHQQTSSWASSFRP